MSEFQVAMLLRIRCEMEALVSQRLAMIVANTYCTMQNVLPAYGETAFDENAAALRAIAPDPHQFT